MRLRSGEDLQDSYTRGSAMRLSQFQPGKINRKLTSRFETGLDSGTIIGELFKYYIGNIEIF